MDIFALVRETVGLRRAYDCTHAWVKASGTEQQAGGSEQSSEQCARCGILATPIGKENLRAATERWHKARGTTPPPLAPATPSPSSEDLAP